MSTYVPTVWVNGQTPAINDRNLNHLEAGTKAAHDNIEDLVTGSTKAGHAVLANRAVTVDKATQTTIGGVRIWVDTTDPLNIIGHIDAR